MAVYDTGEAPEAELSHARQVLRDYQELMGIKHGLVARGDLPSGVDLAVKALRCQRRFEPTDKPNRVTRGIFSFDLEQEERRLLLAEQLIRRVNPGPYEDLNYLALLSYQAASLDIAFRTLAGGRGDERWSKLLLGTAHAGDVNAFAYVEESDGYVVILMHSALVDFIYQAAKVLTSAQNPRRSGARIVTSFPSTDDIKTALQTNREPVERLYRTLEAYLFEGYPRAFWNETVKDEEGPNLSVLIGLAERWTIAHEFGHKLAKGHDWDHPPSGKPNWREEFFADQNATILTVVSTGLLDGLPPEYSLASANFSLACLDLLRRAVSIVRDGKDSEDIGGDTHPPYRARTEQVVETFHKFFDATYDASCRLQDLRLALQRDRKPVVSKRTRKQIGHAFDFANGLFEIWQPVKRRLLRDHATRRPLHSMWS
jgi:hypothetical protein